MRGVQLVFQENLPIGMLNHVETFSYHLGLFAGRPVNELIKACLCLAQLFFQADPILG